MVLLFSHLCCVVTNILF
uniref:Uncharacterized protein n=1 Tax=Arundo donax TaxID=35708 RepID=A0A0A9A6W5_ARUDO